MKSRIDTEYSSLYLAVTVIIVLFLVPVMVNVSIPVMMNVPIMADFEGGHNRSNYKCLLRPGHL